MNPCVSMARDYQLVVGLILNVVGALMVGFSGLNIRADAKLGSYEGLFGIAAPRRPPDVVADAEVARPWVWRLGWGAMCLGYLAQLLSALSIRLL
jgi:hypothetical protein